MRNHTDHEVDKAFGDFITAARMRLNCGWYRASTLTGLAHTRIQSLERGTSHRSVTKAECEAFAQGYGLSLSVLLRIASGETVAA